MDRERLQQVHQTDLTESRVNEDFVDWLKTKGLTWLLAILIGLCAYVFITRFREKAVLRRAEAWRDLSQAALPMSKVDVAAEYDDIFCIPQLANLQAAEILMDSVHRKRPVSSADADPIDATDPAATALTSDERRTYLERAEGHYQTVIDSDDGSLDHTVFAVGAMNGMAAVAESRGETVIAGEWYGRAAARAEQYYPNLAERVRTRSTTVADVMDIRTLPTRQELDQRALLRTEERESIAIDDWLDSLIFPDEGDGDDDTTR
jgi:hypothetical protein